jgi:putative aminopeptidase FrvX
MRVIVCGSRNWKNEEAIRRQLERLPKNTTIVEGGCKGADLIAARVAKRLGLAVEEHPARWGQHGRSAGPIRNREMLETGVNLVLAFHEDIFHSRGTQHMVTIAREADIATYIYDGTEKW